MLFVVDPLQRRAADMVHIMMLKQEPKIQVNNNNSSSNTADADQPPLHTSDI